MDRDFSLQVPSPSSFATSSGGSSSRKCVLRMYQRGVQPKWMDNEQWRALPTTMLVCELRYWTKRRGFRTSFITLVTTLLDAERYPLDDLADLYGRRWGAETNFAHLKTTMEMDVLRCETVAGIQKEMLIFALVYNLTRLVMLAAAEKQGVPVERISFIDALRWLDEARTHQPVLELVINPERPGRCEPRVKKRRAKEYPLMKLPREQLRQQLANKQVAA